MRARLVGLAVGVSLAIGVMGASAASAAPAASSFRVKAVVVSIQPEACGRVLVTLTAITPTSEQRSLFRWDLNGDGIFDTQPSPVARVSHLYAKSATNQFIATVLATNGSATGTARDSVTFSLRTATGA